MSGPSREWSGEEGCLTLCAFPFLCVYGTVLGAYVTQHLWAWLVVPMWSLAPLSFKAAGVLSFLLSYAKPASSLSPKEDAMSAAELLLHNVVRATFYAVFYLGIGYGLHLWVQP